MTAVAPLVRGAIEVVVVGLEAAAAIVVVVAAARALFRYLRPLTRGKAPHAERALRLDFARSLLLALDFAIGGDLLRIALAPTLERVAVAALVVAVRIALTVALLYEMQKEQEGVD